MTYTIIVTPNYYAGTINAPSTHRLTIDEATEDDTEFWAPSPEGMEVAVFDTREKAQAVIDRLESGIYYTSNGEAGRPGYEIAEDDADTPAETIVKGDAIGGSWEQIEENDIPEEIRKSVMESGVEYHSTYNDSYDVYRSYPEEHGDHSYCVAFVVSTLAIQDAEGDLSSLSWDNPIYFRE